VADKPELANGEAVGFLSKRKRTCKEASPTKDGIASTSFMGSPANSGRGDSGCI
jgi:hypothetical protein